MADNTGDRARRNIQEINEIVSAIDSGFRSISSRLEDVADIISNTNTEARVFNNIITDVGRSVNRLSKQNEDLINNEIKLNQGLLTSKKIRQQINDIEATQAVLQSRLNTLKNQELEGLILSGAQLEEIAKLEEELVLQSQDVTLQYQNQLQIIQKIETKLGIFGRLTKGLSRIPLIGDLLDAEGALTAMNKSALAGKSLFANLGAGIKAAFSGIEKSSVILAVVSALYKAIQFFVNALVGADKRVTDIAKNLSISKDAADGIYTNLKNLKGNLDSSLQSTQKIVDAFNELSQLTEFATIATKNQVDAQITLTKQIGISAEAALGFQETLATSNIDAEKGIDIVTNQIAAFANQNKIVADGRKIFESISKTSKLIQLNFRGNLDSLVKTTLQANKLGLSLDQVSKIGSSLLDFESSISAELEAELLTGKNLNLEKARLFALNHDIAGLTQEIANQGITVTSFAAMNVIQQEAIAKTLGMQASELGDALYKQDLINKTAGQYTTRLKEEAALLKKSNDAQEIAKGIALEKRALAIENGVLQGKEIKDAIKQVDVQTNFNDALEQAQELFSDLASGGYLDSLVNGFKDMIGAARSLGTILDIVLVKPLNIIANTLIGIAKILGGISTLNFGLFRSGQKDLAFAGANILDMGVNSAVGVGLTDKKNKNLYTKPMIEAENAIQQKITNTTTQSETTKIASSQQVTSQESLETNRLLRELNENVKQGSNLYLENRLVGQSTAVNTYKI
jgi:hypothetical protein